MATFQYKVGLGNVGSYQVSGVPYATGSVSAGSRAGIAGPVQVAFPSVTSWVVVSNVGGSADLKIGFSENGVNGTVTNCWLSLDQNQVTPKLEVKVTEIWLSGSNGCSVMAGLTGIPNITINNLDVSPDGSNWSGSVGALVG
tara:strand:+ start:305 stop:730 length:426 start_codon:yes stop_codon:yes gene_type:complete